MGQVLQPKKVVSLIRRPLMQEAPLCLRTVPFRLSLSLDCTNVALVPQPMSRGSCKTFVFPWGSFETSHNKGFSLGLEDLLRASWSSLQVRLLVAVVVRKGQVP